MKENHELANILAKKSEVIIKYFEKLYPQNSILQDIAKILERERIAGNIRGLKIVLNDMIDWANDLSKNELNSLNTIFLVEFSEGINDNNKKVVKQILKKNRIDDDDEYRIIKSYCERLTESGDKSDELQKGVHLLANYGNSN